MTIVLRLSAAAILLASARSRCRCSWPSACVCVGGGSNVPLGFVSLVENVGMVLTPLCMLGTLF